MGWYCIANCSQTHDQPISIQTTSKEGAAARRDCQAGTLSPDFEWKHRFIIRLFFWVLPPIPWLRWRKIKARHFASPSPLLMWAAAHASQQWRALSSLQGGTWGTYAAQWTGSHAGRHSLKNPALGKREQWHRWHSHPAAPCHPTRPKALPEESRERQRDLRQGERGHKPNSLSLSMQWWQLWVGGRQAKLDFTDNAARLGDAAKRAWGVGRQEQGAQGALPDGTRQAKSAGSTAIPLRPHLCKHWPVCSQQWREKHPLSEQRPGAGPKTHRGRTRIELTMSLE